MKKSLLIIATLFLSLSANSQTLDDLTRSQCNCNKLTIKENLEIGEEGLLVANKEHIYVKGNIKIKGSGILKMQKGTKIYLAGEYEGNVEPKRHFVEKLRGSVKIKDIPLIKEYDEEIVWILDGDSTIYEGYTYNIPKKANIKRGLYDIRIKGIGYFKDTIIK